ncbi:MAG: hypothetical protein A4E51_01038 [Methanosaeta sp. PtaU1.Bin055]|nr:MAG: hypothetical protein A4E51_01038 [Methanosaeta sp. PtaU1.Bin055]
MPARNMTSPTLVTRKAFLAAEAAEGFRYQNPIKRYEQRPTSSQNMKSWSRLSEKTRPSIAAVKRPASAKYRAIPGSPSMYPRA